MWVIATITFVTLFLSHLCYSCESSNNILQEVENMDFLYTFFITLIIIGLINYVGRRILIGEHSPHQKNDFIVVLVQSLVISILFVWVI